MASRFFLTREQALGAVFNQLVRSRVQLLVAEELFVPSEQAKKNGDSNSYRKVEGRRLARTRSEVLLAEYDPRDQIAR